MSAPTDRSSWFSERSALLVLVVASVTLAALVVLPYLQYVLLAVVLAYVLAPAQRRLERPTSAETSAIVLSTTVVLVLLVPIAYVLSLAIQQGLALAAAIQEGVLEAEAIEARLEAVGVVIDLGDMYATYQNPVTTGIQGVVTSALEIVRGLPNVFIGLTVTLFVLFSLLRDGERLLRWLQMVVPIRDDLQRNLLEELDRLMWASVVGNVAVAAIQAVLLAIGLLLVGVPGVVFLTVATFALALLPLVGAFVVWLPISIYLIGFGRPVAGAALFAYGSLISVSDVYLRPAVIGHSGALSAATVVLGIFGGVVVFGVVGLFIGPVVLGGSKAALDLLARERAPPIANH